MILRLDANDAKSSPGGITPVFHNLLKKQLEKSTADEKSPPNQAVWDDFLKQVDRAYREADERCLMVERSLMISSREMYEVNERLKESETRYTLAAKGANHGLWDWDLETDETYFSERWLATLGIPFDANDINSKNCWFNRIHPDDRNSVVHELDRHIDGRREHFQIEHRVMHMDGEYRWVLVRGLAVRDNSGKACRIAGSLTDITDRKRTEEKLQHDALHDSLTGLPNRTKLMLRLAESLNRAKDDAEYSFAVLFIDIDRFKTVNDSLGHRAGDELLIKFADKLRLLFRPSDLIARLGGDEFVVVIENLTDSKHATKIAKRLLVRLQRPIGIAGNQIYSSASIGIAFSSPDYRESDDLVSDADLAMYKAKVNGKARYEIFNHDMRSGAKSLMQLELDLRRAFEQKEFILHYQPIVSLDNGSIIGFEALVRWIHPSRGVVPPNEFIPVAEETGLILPIGQWILREACRQMREWQERYPLTNLPIVSVNLSARQLEQTDLSSQIEEILKESRLDPKCLRLEITESVIMHNAEQAVITVNELRKMGVRVSIDDFGTGFSSLGYLHRFPVDTLKIDRSFINRIGNEGENAEIVQTIINLATNLNMEVVAEGIETPEQLNFLRAVNCSYGQGYFYSRPLDCDSASRMLRKLVREEYSYENAIPKEHVFLNKGIH
jgi:diguanylate cyclase (GGDEF)-like protein/PAS domain S-box-containing protein